MIGRSATPGACSRSPVPSTSKPLPSADHCPASTVRTGLLRHPGRPDLAPHGSSVGTVPYANRQGFPMLRPFAGSSTRAADHYPGGTGQVLPSLASRPLAAFPDIQAESASAIARESRPARRLLALPSPRARKRTAQEAALCRRSASADVVTWTSPLRLLPAGATVAGRDSHPLVGMARFRWASLNNAELVESPFLHLVVLARRRSTAVTSARISYRPEVLKVVPPSDFACSLHRVRDSSDRQETSWACRSSD